MALAIRGSTARKLWPCAALAVVCSIASCDAYNESVGDHFRLMATDTLAELALYHFDGEVYVGVVGPKVTAIGYDERHILVRQDPAPHRRKSGLAPPYFYLVTIEPEPSEFPRSIQGPMTHAELLKARETNGVAAELVLRDVPLRPPK